MGAWKGRPGEGGRAKRQKGVSEGPCRESSPHRTAQHPGEQSGGGRQSTLWGPPKHSPLLGQECPRAKILLPTHGNPMGPGHNHSLYAFPVHPITLFQTLFRVFLGTCLCNRTPSLLCHTFRCRDSSEGDSTGDCSVKGKTLLLSS